MSTVPEFGSHFQESLDYLKARGRTYDEAVKLGFQFITHAEANDRVGTPPDKRSFYPRRAALWIPTTRPDGTAHPHHGQAIFFNPGKPPFKVHTKTTDLQPNDVNYLLGARKLVPGDTVYWCESTLKAAVLQVGLGLPAIGMNGVFGWSKGKGRLVTSAKELPPGLVHVLITDSLNDKNNKSRTNVLRARRAWRLAVRRELQDAIVRYIEMPRPPEDWPKADWGLDDYLMRNGIGAVEALLRNATEFHDDDELRILLEDCNAQFVYVKSVSKTYDRDENALLSKQQLFDNYASLNAADTPVLPSWFKSADRREVSSLAFRPGEPELVDGCLNLWQGFDVEPSANDIAVKKYWLDTIFDAFGEDGRYLVEIFAVLVQSPGRRLPRHIFINGKQGSGKNFIVEPLARIFASHTQNWSVKNFINNFNVAHYKCRLGILNETGDPHFMAKADLVAVGELLKKNADPNERKMQLEPKGSDISTVDRLQFNITISNYGPPFELQAGDRRCVALLARQHMQIQRADNLGTKSEAYWAERWNWLNNEGGAAEVLSYLLRYDVSAVDFEGPAPMTEYKRSLVFQDSDAVRPFLERFNVDPLGVIRAVLGPEYQLPEVVIFNATIVQLLFEALVRSVDNPQAFTTQVGKLAQSVWECASTQITMRAKDGMKAVRVYQISGGRICKFTVGPKLGAKQAVELLDALATDLLRSTKG